MKIKTDTINFKEFENLKPYPHVHPKKPSKALWALVRAISKKDLKDTNFKYTLEKMDKLKKDESCIILMNHSSFIDLKMVSVIFKERPFNIVCTDDGFVGKEWLLRGLGCIPTKKFITDNQMVRDMKYAIEKLGSSILIYPEASYTFDGTTTPLPSHFAKFLKVFQTPVVMVKTKGAFLRDPLYNNLQLRNVDTSANVKYLFSKEDLKSKSLDEISSIINKEFEYDHFKDQKESGIRITEDFRADYLNRIVYKCPSCKEEGKMVGKGIMLSCEACGKEFKMEEDGSLSNSPISHIPDIYKWEREEVIKEIENSTYRSEFDCDIYGLKDLKALHKLGEGHLVHDREGFHLTSNDNQIDIVIQSKQQYSLYSDYFWYEIGDMVCIGNVEERFYLFPKNVKDIVAKMRIATEEIYKRL